MDEGEAEWTKAKGLAQVGLSVLAQPRLTKGDQPYLSKVKGGERTGVT